MLDGGVDGGLGVGTDPAATVDRAGRGRPGDPGRGGNILEGRRTGRELVIAGAHRVSIERHAGNVQPVHRAARSAEQTPAVSIPSANARRAPWRPRLRAGPRCSAATPRLATMQRDPPQALWRPADDGAGGHRVPATVRRRQASGDRDAFAGDRRWARRSVRRVAGRRTGRVGHAGGEQAGRRHQHQRGPGADPHPGQGRPAGPGRQVLGDLRTARGAPRPST